MRNTKFIGIALTLKIALVTIVVSVIALLGFNIYTAQAANTETNESNAHGTWTLNIADGTDYAPEELLIMDDFDTFYSQLWTKGDNVFEKVEYAEEILEKDILNTSDRCYIYYEADYWHDIRFQFYNGETWVYDIYFFVNNEECRDDYYCWYLGDQLLPEFYKGEDPIMITDFNQDLTFTVKQNPKFNIAGNITSTENTATPIEYAQIQYYKGEIGSGTPVEGAYAETDSNGYFEINAISSDDAPGYLFIDHNRFESKYVEITNEMVKSKGILNLELQLVQKEDVEANFVIIGGDHHKQFHYYFRAVVAGEELISEDYVDEINELAIYVGGTYTLNEKGVMSFRYPEGKVEVDEYTMTVEPIGEDGFVVDKWNINGNDVEVGKENIIESGDELDCFVTYKVPDPVPEPTPENIDSTVQTGDATAVAVITFLIIASLSAGFILRKNYK